MERVQHIFQRLSGVEFPDVAIETYRKQVTKNKRQKVNNRMRKNRMLKEHDGHFQMFADELLALDPAHLEFLAFKSKRFGTGNAAAEGEEAAAEDVGCGELVKGLEAEKRAQTAAIQRLYRSMDGKGAQFKEAHAGKAAAAAKEHAWKVDEMEGQRQGLEFRLASNVGEAQRRYAGCARSELLAARAVRRLRGAHRGWLRDAGEIHLHIMHLLTLYLFV